MLASLRNLIKEHWQGDFTLGFAYWVIGVGVTLLLSLLIFLVDKLLTILSINANIFGGVLILLCGFVLLITVWQLVGIWRSARYHTSRGGRVMWANAARIMVIIAAVRAVVDFNQFGLGQLQEGFGLLAQGESLGTFELRILNQGKELELIGSLPFGTADSVQALLERYPDVEVIHLNSKGGRISEGVRLYQLIQQYNLNTYSPSECSSACTIAFMGGAKRYLGKRGILGFHSASLQSVDGNDVAQLNDEFKRIYRRHGVSESFIRQAVRVAGADIWYPGQLELLDARVVDELVPSERFASTNAFGDIKANWQPEHLQQAPDAELVNYWQATVDVLNYLNYLEPRYCVNYMYPQWRADGEEGVDVESILPANLITAHENAVIKLIERTQLRSDYRSRTGTAPILFESVRLQLEQRNPEYLAVLDAPKQFIDSPRLLCSATIALYEGALRQSTLDRQAALLRYLQQE
ncbi:hypothetical protein [Pseudidiomarina gelatinasegens]|mgnify:CR=1 FL=1|uniref:COG3904 family protein n=1 Tax=Pseudidiomarina gelatinasegens TaxID=2487740 RepID=UPI0030EEB132|tara:strand:+ start:638 stop:2035 length:1398 start_codon:yes stop_codon:yes gene_type:complete